MRQGANLRACLASRAEAAVALDHDLVGAESCHPIDPGPKHDAPEGERLLKVQAHAWRRKGEQNKSLPCASSHVSALSRYVHRQRASYSYQEDLPRDHKNKTLR